MKDTAAFLFLIAAVAIALPGAASKPDPCGEELRLPCLRALEEITPFEVAGNYRQAAVTADRLYAKYRDSVWAPNILRRSAVLWMKAGENDRGLDRSLQFIERFNPDTCGYGYLLQTTTWLYLKKGDYRNLEKYAQKYLEEFPAGKFVDVIQIRRDKARQKLTPRATVAGDG